MIFVSPYQLSTVMKNVLLISPDTGLADSVRANLLSLNIALNVLPSSDNVFTHLRNNRPDLVMIDFILQDINGGGLCHQIKCDPELHDLPVVLLSEFPGLKRFSTKFGCNLILNKPLDMNAVMKILDGRQVAA